MHALAGVRGNVYLSKITAVCLRNSPFFGAHNRLFYSPRGCLSFFFLVFLFSLFSSPFASGYICPFFPRCVNTSRRFNDFSFHTLAPSNHLAIFILVPHCVPIYSQTSHPNSPFAIFPPLSPLKPILPSLPLGSTSAPPNTFIMGSVLVPHKSFFLFCRGHRDL